MTEQIKKRGNPNWVKKPIVEIIEEKEEIIPFPTEFDEPLIDIVENDFPPLELYPQGEKENCILIKEEELKNILELVHSITTIDIGKKDLIISKLTNVLLKNNDN